MSSSNTCSYTHKSTVARRMSSKRDCCCARGRARCEAARWPGGRVAALEVRDGQATRRGASCYTQQITCKNLLFMLNAQSKRHGAQRVPTLAPGCTRGPPACPAAESARKDPRPAEKSRVMCKKRYSSIHIHTRLPFEM